MSLLTKSILLILFFALCIAVIYGLPLTADHPLDPTFTTAVQIIFGYLFAWAGVFTAINYLLYAALASVSMETGILLYRFVIWLISKVAARFVG